MTAPASWLGHYDEGVPATLAPYPDRTLPDYLRDAARDQPNSPAIYFKGATLTFGDIADLSDACAIGFASIGVRAGDRVALLLPNCPQFVIAQFALWKLGAIVAPINPTYSDSELDGPLRDHGVETLVTLTRFYERFKTIQARTRVTRVVATNIKDFFPPVLKALFTLVRERHDGDRVMLRDGDRHLMPLIELNRGRQPEPRQLQTTDPAVLLMSGGTTGTPKGVLGAHGAYTMAGLQIVAWLRSIVEGETRAIFAPLPLFHVYSNVGIQSLSIIARLPMALVPNPRDIPDLVATLRRVKPAFFNGVPTLVHRASQSAGGSAGQGGLQVDPYLRVWRGGAPCRHQATLRRHHRRTHRRGLLADGSDDGVVREPREGREQDRIGRNAAARRPREDRGRRRGRS